MACQKDDNNDVSKNTFLYYSVNGASCNGEFYMEENTDAPEVSASALIIPEDGDRPEVVVMTFIDTATNRVVYWYLPAETGGPFLMTDTTLFSLGISDAAHNCVLESGVENTNLGVSFHVTKFERGIKLGHQAVDQMEVHFEGIMSYRNAWGVIEMHTIDGNFFYKGPS